MKRAFAVTVLMIVALVAAAIPASAGIAPSIRLSVPFSFYAGNQLFPAGDYIIEMAKLTGTAASTSVIAVRTVDGSVFRFLQTATSSTGKGPAYSATFTRYGGIYFLSKVQNSHVEVTLPRTRAERMATLACLRELQEPTGRTIPGASN